MQTEGLRCHSQTKQTPSLLRGRAMRIPQLRKPEHHLFPSPNLRKAHTIVRRWCEEMELGYAAVTLARPSPRTYAQSHRPGVVRPVLDAAEASVRSAPVSASRWECTVPCQSRHMTVASSCR